MELSHTSSFTETNTFMQRVYGWMTLALTVSGGIAFYVSHDVTLLTAIFEKGLFTPLLFGEIILVIALSFFIRKMNAVVATLFFILYAVATGVTLSVIFIAYELGSVVSIFGISAAIFGVMSLYGYTTKKDLTGTGTLAIFGLFGIVLAGIVNIFLKNTMTDMIISSLGVLIFIVLTAYDTQRIKAMSQHGDGTDDGKKMAIIGALSLYLDFINLFLKLLSLFGKRR